MPSISSIRTLESGRARRGRTTGWGGEMRLLTLSDGRRLRVDAEQIARRGLASGEAIEAALLDRLKTRDLYLRARQTAVRLLAIRPRSGAELRMRLQCSGIPDRQIRAVLRDLIAAGYLDDLAFARAWITGRMTSRLSGVKRLRWELREKGIAAPIIEQAIQEAFEGEGAASVEVRCARALIARRLSAYRGLAPERRARRVAGLLERRGFASGTIVHILRELERPDPGEAVDG
jgi:regulatory protein